MKKTKYIILAAVVLVVLLVVISYYLISKTNGTKQSASNPQPSVVSDRAWSANNNNQTLSSKDSAGKTSAINVGFPVANLFPSPDSSAIVVEKQNTNNSPSMTYYSVGAQKTPKEIGQNIQSFAWISNDAYVYYQKTPDTKGQLVLSSLKSAPLLSNLDAPTVQIVPADKYLFLSYYATPDGEDFTHLRIDLATNQSSTINVPKDKSIISTSPSADILILANPNATLKGVFTYNLSTGKLTELPSTPFTATIKWIDQSRFLFLKDSAEPPSIDKITTELKPNAIALYDLTTNQEKMVISGEASQISSFALKGTNITYVTSVGDIINREVSF